MSNSELLIRVISYYVTQLTDGGKKCPTVDQMREIVQLDDITKTLTAKVLSETQMPKQD